MLLVLLYLPFSLVAAQTVLSPNSFSRFNNSATYRIPTKTNLTLSICAATNARSRLAFTLGADALALNNDGFVSVDTDGGHELKVTGSGEYTVMLTASENAEPAPTLGDTTSNQALLFSSSFFPASHSEPATPNNYTLPSVNPPLESPPGTPANHTLLITLTSSKESLACASASLGVLTNQSNWYSPDLGWRNQFLVSGLLPGTNYTARLISASSNTLSRPLFFATKSASFDCPLVHNLPYCPGVSWAVPLPPPPGPRTVYDDSNLPSQVSEPIIEVLNNFTATLGTFPCGRDSSQYSVLQSCSDCHRAYRRWLCTISFKRCSEPSPSSPQSISPPKNEYQEPFDATQSRPVSALVAEPTTGPGPGSATPRLLPCLEVCNKVERACPAFLQFKCPLKRFNAAFTYGVGYEDSGDDLGEWRGVVPRGVQDEWGNVWCNRGY